MNCANLNITNAIEPVSLGASLAGTTLNSVGSLTEAASICFKTDTVSSLDVAAPFFHDVSWPTGNWTIKFTSPVPRMPALPEIVEVIFHDDTHTTIRWADGTATDVSCGEGEEYNEYEGFCAAVVKKLFEGTGNAKRVMREKNLTEQRRLAKEAEEKKRQEEAEALARKKARSKRRYIKKMAKKMLMEEDIQRQAAELAKKMREGK